LPRAAHQNKKQECIDGTIDMTRASLKGLGLSLTGIIVAIPELAAEENEGGLPQLDFSTWPTQIFWLVISFALAYVLMQRIVTPRIASVLEERHARLDNDLLTARQATEKAETLRMNFEQALAEARTKASEKTRETLATAQAEAEQQNKAAGDRIATHIAEAEVRIGKARDEAMKEIGEVAIESAIDAAETLAGIKVAKTDAEKAVAAATKAMPRARERN
jgi:F-type H+-transporting ATPase subunit b